MHISSVRALDRSRRRREAARRLREGDQRRPVRAHRGDAGSQPRQHRHGRIRDERGEPRPHPRASAWHGRAAMVARSPSTARRGAAARTRAGSARSRACSAVMCASARRSRSSRRSHKMTALPASRIRLADRGRLATGFAADVVVFDPGDGRRPGDVRGAVPVSGRDQGGGRERRRCVARRSAWRAAVGTGPASINDQCGYGEHG